ncbi:MAG: hypothetical protein WCO71_04505 [Pseudomonadota bacterium]
MISTSAIFWLECITQGFNPFFDGYAVDVGCIAHVKVDLKVFDMDVGCSGVACQKDVGGLGAKPPSNGCAVGAPFVSFFGVFHLSTGINYKENIFKALILLGGSYCTYSFDFR